MKIYISGSIHSGTVIDKYQNVARKTKYVDANPSNEALVFVIKSEGQRFSQW
jgi:hypothetical protein